MRREYVGAARKARLASPLGGTALDLGILGDDLTGWPEGTEPFFIVIDRGLATEEKILCELRSTNSLTVYTDGVINGRGADGTAISAHEVGAYLEHVFTATDADEANEHVNSTANVHGVISDVVGVDDVQTLTNKSIDGTANTLTNIAQASVVGLVSKLSQLDATDDDLQAQITALEAGKADVDNPTFTGTVVLPSTTSIGDVSATEIGYLNGVTANIQTQINAKAPIDSPTFTGDPVLPASTLIGGVTIDSITGGGLAVPAGGAEGEILVKNSDADYDMSWQPISFFAVPGGGSIFIVSPPYPTGGTITTYIDATTGYEFRSHQFLYSGAVDSFVNTDPFIGQLLLVGGGGHGAGSGGGTSAGGGGGSGGVYFGDYAFGGGIHNLRVGQANGGVYRDTWIDYDVTGVNPGGILVYGGGNGGSPGQDGGFGGGGSANGNAGGTGLIGIGGETVNHRYGNGTASAGAGNGGTGGGASFVTNIATGSDVTYAVGAPGETGNGAGVANTGSGGQGAVPFYQPGGDGSNGIVVIRYRIA